MNAEHRALAVPEGLAGLRVDAAVSRLFGLSRTVAANLVDDSVVLVDGRPVHRAHRLVAGTWLEAEIPTGPGWIPPEETALPDGLAIVHDDPDLLVVDKPAGVATHPSPGFDGPSVTGGLAAAGYRLAESGPAERRGVVHRLDVGTSGLLVLARSETAYTSLKEQFRSRTVGKTYRALVQGHPDPWRGTIDAPIDRDPRHSWRFAVIRGGRDSVTHYQGLEAMRAVTLVEVRLETGRTHQIRVHFAALHHPCVGDALYGCDPVLAERLGLSRQWLHAADLEIEHPRGGRARWHSDDPAELATALARARAAGERR